MLGKKSLVGKIRSHHLGGVGETLSCMAYCVWNFLKEITIKTTSTTTDGAWYGVRKLDFYIYLSILIPLVVILFV